jgi:hypothetical protein
MTNHLQIHLVLSPSHSKIVSVQQLMNYDILSHYFAMEFQINSYLYK